jgi:DNA transposition AAA+ family ATPase
MDAVALYRYEKERNRKNNILKRFEYSRPLCEYCQKYTAQNMGTERKDGSKMLRKYQGRYMCGKCHAERLGTSSRHQYHDRMDVYAY